MYDLLLQKLTGVLHQIKYFKFCFLLLAKDIIFFCDDLLFLAMTCWYEFLRAIGSSDFPIFYFDPLFIVDVSIL